MKAIEQSDNTEANIEVLEKQADSYDNDLGLCILWVLDDAHDNTNAYQIAKGALAELAALKAERDRLAKVAEAARHYVYMRAPGSSPTKFPTFQRLKDALKDLDSKGE